MKIRLLLCSLALALTCASGLQAQTAPGPGQRREREPETELGKTMEKLNGAFRKLRRPDPATKVAQITDASKNEDSLKQVAIIRECAVASAKLEPALKAKKPADEQAKFVAAYQEQMKAFIADIDKVAAALKANDNATAAKLLEQLNDDQKKGHTDFRPPPQRRG